MKYTTYQAAKIANPDQEIYELNGKFQTGDTPARPGDKWELCNPADYCISLSDFRELDYEVCHGDLILGIDGTFVEVSNVYNYNKPWHGDDKRFILKANALEETKTYRFEKVTFEKSSEAVAAWEDGELFTKVSHETYTKIETAPGVLTYLYRLYRRIEVTERELFIEELENLANKFAEWKGLQRVDDLDRDFFGYLFDSGKFKLVNGKG